MGEVVPDTFLVGAPKCGTTAMASYLSAHPDIYVGPKELNYFGRDLVFRLSGRPSWTEYSSKFSDGQGARRIVDASVWYLYSRSAAHEIRTIAPAASIIIMLRNPVDMMPSLHGQLLYTTDEEIRDFELALAAEPERKLGRNIPRGCDLVNALYYREVASYSEQVSRYVDEFGRDQVHVILFDEMATDTAQAYHRLLSFLGLDDLDDLSFDVVNAHRRLRSVTLGRLIRHQPAYLRAIGRRIIPDQGARRWLGERLSGMNARVARREPLSIGSRYRLAAEMADEVQRLESVLGRDLSAWTKADPRPVDGS